MGCPGSLLSFAGISRFPLPEIFASNEKVDNLLRARVRRAWLLMLHCAVELLSGNTSEVEK